MKFIGVIPFVFAAAEPVYDEDAAIAAASYARAAYCSSSTLDKWTCGKPCEDAPINPNEVRALQPPAWNPFDSSTWFQFSGFVGMKQTELVPKCVIGFSGPRNFDVPNWMASHMYWSSKISAGLGWENTCPDCEVSYGYLKAYEGLQTQIVQAWKDLDCTSGIVVGHSSGGALASMAAFDLRANHNYRIEAVWTYGMPRVGNQAFVDAFVKSAHDQMVEPPMWRIVHYKDIVPREPTTEETGYVHMPYEVYYTSEEGSNFKMCNSASSLEEDPSCSDSVSADECNTEDGASYFANHFPGPAYAFDSTLLPDECIPASEQKTRKDLWPFVVGAIVVLLCMVKIINTFCLSCCGCGDAGHQKTNHGNEPLLMSAAVTTLSKPAYKQKFLVYVTSTSAIRGGDRISIGTETVLVESNDGTFLSLQEALKDNHPAGTQIRKL